MMARSSKAPSIGRIQKRKTNLLQIIIFGLQRAAGPYRWAMYGRCPRCKSESDFLRSVRVQPCIRPVFEWRTSLHCDATAMAAGPDVIR